MKLHAPVAVISQACKIHNDFVSGWFSFSISSISVKEPSANELATAGLAKVGARTALSFAFAFLKRAWRSGEDSDLCTEVLQEASEILQELPVALMFDSQSVSGVWLDVVERTMKFLSEVCTGLVYVCSTCMYMYVCIVLEGLGIPQGIPPIVVYVGPLFDHSTTLSICWRMVVIKLLCVHAHVHAFVPHTHTYRLKIEEEKGIPLEDRQAALSLLLELALQRGTLSHILDSVLLLLRLSGVPDNARNINMAEEVKKKLPPEFQPQRPPRAETSYPLLPFLRRLNQVPTPISPVGSEGVKEEAKALSPTKRYLEFLTLPNDDSTKVDLQQVATVTLSHLDRIAEPYYSTDMVRNTD